LVANSLNNFLTSSFREVVGKRRSRFVSDAFLVSGTEVFPNYNIA